jgi:hypothetical protein
VHVTKQDDDGQSFRRNLFALNGLDIQGQPLEILSKEPRKGPHRLGAILDADRITVIITNRRARAGMKPNGFSR